MKEKKEVPRWLRWPWNLVICIVLVLVLRIFAIPVILALLAWQKKCRPDGPEEGYCLRRTRRRLARLVWSVLFLALALACGVTFWVRVQEDRAGWEAMDYVVLAAAALLCVGFAAATIYETYTDLRDALFPEKSRLARSIRSQLPHPDDAPGVKELFAMVDQDIRENGQWFDRVAVGREWVFGDDVSAISRIRVVFGRDEIVHHRHDGRTQTARIIELYILDDRRQTQVTALRDPNELKAVLDCIRLRAPDALVRPYSEYFDYCGKSDDEWEALLRDFRSRQSLRASRQVQEEQLSGQEGQNMVLTLMDGTVTSRVTGALLRQTLLDGLERERNEFVLTPGQPVTAQGRTFLALECATAPGPAGEPPVQLLLRLAPEEPDAPAEEGLRLQTDEKQAEEILRGWLRGEVPDLRDWTPARLWRRQEQQDSRQQEARPPKLVLISSAGVRQGHDRFTLEDVQVAADGIVDGSYQSVDLTLPGGYLWMWVKTGDAADGRCTVKATRADGGQLRFFTTQCTHRQAAAWLTAYAKGTFQPGGADWKEYTKQVKKGS